MRVRSSATGGPDAAESRGAASAGDGLAERQRRFWRWVSLWTLLGLAGWAFLTFVVIWFARDLDRWTFARVPAGYWWAAQGAIGGFLLIIVAYCLVMERLEARFLDEVRPPERDADLSLPPHG